MALAVGARVLAHGFSRGGSGGWPMALAVGDPNRSSIRVRLGAMAKRSAAMLIPCVRSVPWPSAARPC